MTNPRRTESLAFRRLDELQRDIIKKKENSDNDSIFVKKLTSFKSILSGEIKIDRWMVGLLLIVLITLGIYEYSTGNSNVIRIYNNATNYINGNGNNIDTTNIFDPLHK